jgi:3-hydroxy acid dehydrogenase/malonic semialdehyde reductase
MAASLQGKRVLVTGAAGGVGRAVATQMAAAGARVLLTDRNQGDLQSVRAELSRTGGAVEAVAGDLTAAADLQAVFGRVDEWLGGLDILVACAAVGSGPLLEMDDFAWRQVIDINLVSYVACTRAALDRMRAEGGKEAMVILVGSISVHIKAVGESVYNASKGGVASFAETLRKELMSRRDPPHPDRAGRRGLGHAALFGGGARRLHGRPSDAAAERGRRGDPVRRHAAAGHRRRDPADRTAAAEDLVIRSRSPRTPPRSRACPGRCRRPR